jgi:predicted branched-subunit amino acid permease
MSGATLPVSAAPARRGYRLALEGARDMTPMVLGVLPFAIAIGAAVSTSSLTAAQGLASGPVILAGSAQLAAVQMLDAGTATVVVIVSALVINARILLYSMAIAPWFRDQPLRRRLLLALPIVDQVHFTVTPRFQRGDLDSSERVAYYAGAAAWLCGAWLATQALAIGVGARLPDSLGLELAAPLVMAGLLAKSMDSRPTVVAGSVAGVLSVVAVGLPLHTSLLVATLVGIAAGRVTRPSRPRALEPPRPEPAWDLPRPPREWVR